MDEELPLSRASAFQRRNRTTHSWYGDWSTAGCIMSQSCPSPQTLEQHMRNARAAMSVSSSFYQPQNTAASRSSSASKASSPPPAGMSKTFVPGAKSRAQYGRSLSAGRGFGGGAGVAAKARSPPVGSHDAAGVQRPGSLSGGGGGGGGGGGAFRSNSMPDGDGRHQALSASGVRGNRGGKD